MKKIFLSIILFVIAFCINAQNFTMSELVSVLKTKSVETAQRVLEKKGLEFMFTQKIDENSQKITYGYNIDPYHNNRASYFIHLTYSQYGKNLKSICIDLPLYSQKQKYDEYLNVVKNVYKAKFNETLTFGNNSVDNVYNGETIRFVFSTIREQDDVNGKYKTHYAVYLYWGWWNP